jgi:hypothetical protein
MELERQQATETMSESVRNLVIADMTQPDMKVIMFYFGCSYLTACAARSVGNRLTYSAVERFHKQTTKID